MKKLLVFIIGILLLSSCDNNLVKGGVTKTIAEENNKKSNKEYINVNMHTYYKTKMGNHDVYQYTFHTQFGDGSDIVHFEDMCDYCKNLNK